MIGSGRGSAEALRAPRRRAAQGREQVEWAGCSVSRRIHPTKHKPIRLFETRLTDGRDPGRTRERDTTVDTGRDGTHRAGGGPDRDRGPPRTAPCEMHRTVGS